MITGISTVPSVGVAREADEPFSPHSKYNTKIAIESANVLRAIPTSVDEAPNFIENKAISNAVIIPIIRPNNKPNHAFWNKYEPTIPAKAANVIIDSIAMLPIPVLAAMKDAIAANNNGVDKRTIVTINLIENTVEARLLSIFL